MQYHQRSRLPPPPPPPFGRGGGAVYPRGYKQLYAPPPPRPPLPAPPPPPQRRYEVLMEAGRLAAEYLVSTGVLPPSSLQRGSGAWAAPLPPPPPPPPQQQQEPPPFYGRRRYEDVYSNNPSTRPRRNNSTSSSSSSRDDYCNGGNYNGRGKRKYGEFRRGYSDLGREREKERGRSSSNDRRYEEDEDGDGAPGFRRDRRGSEGNDEAMSCVTEEVRETTPLMVKAVVELEMEDMRSKAVSSSGAVRRDADAPPEVRGENEEGEMKEDKVLSSESEVVEQGMDANGDVNKACNGVFMEAEAKLLPDGKVADEKAEGNNKVLCETSLDHIASDDEVTNLENGLHIDRRNLLKYCDFAKAPTKPRSVRAHRNTSSVQRKTAVTEPVDLVSSGEASRMVVNETRNEISLTNILSDNRVDQIYKESTGSSAACNGIMELMLLQEKKTSAVTENMREDKNDAQIHVDQEYKEETDVSLLTKDNLMQETDLSPLTASHNDGLMQESNLSLTDSHKTNLIRETNISPLTDQHKDSLSEETNLSLLTDQHKDSLIEETDISPLTASHEDSLMHETDLPRTLSSHENNLNLQFKEGTQICDIEMLPQDVDLIELSDQRDIVGAELFSNVGTETVIKMEEEKLDQSSSFKICGLSLVGDARDAAIHNNPGLGQCSTEVSSVEAQKQQQEGFGASAGDNAGGTDDLSHLSLDNKSVQVIDIEDDTPIEVVGFGSSKAKNEMICSSMDNMTHPGIHTDDLPIIQDGYNLAISDYLGADIPCYTSMQPDLPPGICTNDSEGMPVMDDPIYGSLTDIGFMDVWGEPAQDFEKFF